MIKNIGLLLLVTLVISAIISPPIFIGFTEMISNRWPYSRVYDRVVLVVFILTIFLFRKKFIWGNNKFKFSLKLVKEYSLGLLLALVPAFVAIPLIVQNGHMTWLNVDFNLQFFLVKILKLIPLIIVVPILEELIFRWFIFGQLKTKFKWQIAALICSALYAVLHFVAPVKSFVPAKGDWFAGFTYYGVVFERILNPELIIYILVLFLIGYFLCAVYQRSGSLTLCIGLHAGWIAAIKIAKMTTTTTTTGLVERYFLLGIPLTWLAILLTFTLTLLIIKLRKKNA